MTVPTRYSCSLAGACEEDPYGSYDTIQACSPRCKSQANKDVKYLLASFSLDGIMALAPSDQLNVLRKQYNIPTADTLLVAQVLRELHRTQLHDRLHNPVLQQLFEVWSNRADLVHLMRGLYTPEEYLVEVVWGDALLSPAISSEYYASVRKEVIRRVPLVVKDYFNWLGSGGDNYRSLSILFLPYLCREAFIEILKDIKYDSPNFEFERRALSTYFTIMHQREYM